MDVFLYYLYYLEPYGQADTDPEQLKSDRCKITIHLSSGETRVYRQQGSRYLSVDAHRWQKIRKSQGSVLFHLVNHIESDE